MGGGRPWVCGGATSPDPSPDPTPGSLEDGQSRASVVGRLLHPRGTHREHPKSAMRQRSTSLTRRLSGLMSRWTMPRSCRYCRPFTRPAKYRLACSSGMATGARGVGVGEVAGGGWDADVEAPEEEAGCSWGSRGAGSSKLRPGGADLRGTRNNVVRTGWRHVKAPAVGLGRKPWPASGASCEASSNYDG